MTASSPTSAAADRRDADRFQQRFDALAACGPDVRALALEGGRTARYVDAGRPSWRALVFLGGLGTSVGAFSLTEFARSTRERLELRAISVERNGFGGTPFDPSLGYAEAADDTLAVLAALAVERFVLVAFSGGGPFAAALAARAPQRLISLHLAAAAAGGVAAPAGSEAARFADPAALAGDPGSMWQFAEGSQVRRIPGFVEAARAEGERALRPATRGALALAHEWRLLRHATLPDLREVRAPAYLYWGEGDEVVGAEHLAAWSEALPNVAARRRYGGEGHDVMYRHWDQILVDAAGGGDRTLICDGGRGRLVPTAQADAYRVGGATLGLCSWASTAPHDVAELA